MGRGSSGGGMRGWGASEKAAYKAMTKKGGAYGYSKAKAIKAVNANKKYYDQSGGEDIPIF